ERTLAGTANFRNLDDGTPTLDDAYQHDDKRQYQQNVDKAAQRVGADHPYQPKQKQDHKDCPKHVCTPHLAVVFPFTAIAPTDHRYHLVRTLLSKEDRRLRGMPCLSLAVLVFASSP